MGEQLGVAAGLDMHLNHFTKQATTLRNYMHNLTGGFQRFALKDLMTTNKTWLKIAQDHDLPQDRIPDHENYHTWTSLPHHLHVVHICPN